MLKRLIEVALPLKEVSEQSAREKSIRHGHISTLHIWWARRPLAACRAAVFASLIPDPDDPECPDDFRKLVMETLSRSEFKPKNGDGSTVEDTPRNRCLEFIKYLVRWENSNKPEYVEPARKLIAAAHKFLHPDAEADAPKVLDPFAGGGAIPLEALRLGCEAHAVDINPVAHLIQLCTLVYPQKYGQPDSRPVPDYIKRLIAHNRSKQKAKSGKGLFDEGDPPSASSADDIIPDVDITEAEYRNNPLAADVKFWGHWVLEQARKQVGAFYPADKDGSIPVAFLWARTVKSPDPTVNATIPLLRQMWLCKKSKRKVALRMTPNQKTGRCDFTIAEGKQIDFDPDDGTMKRGQAICPFTKTVANSKYLQSQGNAGHIGDQLLAVVTTRPGRQGKSYRVPTSHDIECFEAARQAVGTMTDDGRWMPNEPLKPWSGVLNAPLFGMTTWGSLYNPRQKLAMAAFCRYIVEASEQVRRASDSDYAKAVGTYLGVCLDQLAPFTTSLNRWKIDAEAIVDIWGRQAIPMVWDYCENNPVGSHGGTWEFRLHRFMQPVEGICNTASNAASVSQGNAATLSFDDNSLDAVVTDPPYYDAVPYSDLSDFFYVWLKRSVGGIHTELFRTPLTPKRQELVSHLGKNYPGQRKTAQDYEVGMTAAFSEMQRVTGDNGVVSVMFAHRTTSAWETIIAGLLNAGLNVSASWPIHTEMKSRQRGQDSAALASSVTLVCRKRASDAGTGIWDDVRQELKTVAQERLDFFWNQGIRGADFFISAIGPALSVFGKYERVTKLSGEEVTVGQFLDEVRSLVSNYALTRILKTSHTGVIDPESRFYVVWKWSYADAKVPADESFKLSQALGLDTDRLWDRTGVLEKSGENVQATPVSKRMKIKNLGEPTADGAPASLIDVLHRLCAFRDKGDMQGMAQFLGRSGHANNHSLWLVAQAVSEILPDGEKEKQLMQGLLNQREGLEEATRQRELF